MISEIVKKHGAANIASKINESVQTICNWITRGVPVDKTVAFCKAVNFDITPHKMHPEQYPHPDDGLPPDMRCDCKKAA